MDYLIDSSETNPTISPIGITQHNADAGDVIEVCILGYKTAIAYNGDTTPKRGSQIYTAPTASEGKVQINVSGGTDEGRLGFMAQSDCKY